MCVQMSLYMYVKIRGQLQVFLRTPFFFSFLLIQDHSLTCNSAIRLSWLASESQGCPCLHFLIARVLGVKHRSLVFCLQSTLHHPITLSFSFMYPIFIEKRNRRAQRGKPCALCPVPYALCPAPCALHPVSCALCSAPCALCPMLCVLCPAPYTLRPLLRSILRVSHSLSHHKELCSERG